MNTLPKIQLPKTIEHKTEFAANGATFYVKKKRAAVFVLIHEQNRTRSRWGNAAEIRQDIAHAMTFGTLPPEHGRNW